MLRKAPANPRLNRTDHSRLRRPWFAGRPQCWPAMFAAATRLPNTRR